MNQTERTALGLLWLEVAQIYGMEIKTPQMKLMLNAVDDLPFPAARAALERWPAVTKANRHPFPAELRDAVAPSVDPRLVATDLAKRICAAIKRKGYVWEMNGGYRPHASFRDAVLAELGPLAWEVIQRSGGWLSLHDSFFNEDEGTFVAQLRDHVQSVSALARSGELRALPRLPAPASGEALPPPQPVRIGDVAKRIAEGAAKIPPPPSDDGPHAA